MLAILSSDENFALQCFEPFLHTCRRAKHQVCLIHFQVTAGLRYLNQLHMPALRLLSTSGMMCQDMHMDPV